MRTSPQSGMNIFELIFFVANCAIGATVARRGFEHWGWFGGVLGFIAGFAIIPTVFMFPAWLCQRARKKGTR
jgi:hypothetical protein